MIIFDGVSKSFWQPQGRKVILDRASFLIEPGSSVGILAANGTGKSTLINMIAGIEPPDEGRIERRCRVSFPLGYVGGINLRQSGTENIRFIARLHHADPDEVEAFCHWLADLGRAMDMPVSTYSHGMRARLSYALMLALDFDIYLVDEGMPTTTDAAFNARAEAVLAERMKTASMVMVSHQLETLRKFCQAGALLKNGKVIPCASLDEAWIYYSRSEAA